MRKTRVRRAAASGLGMLAMAVPASSQTTGPTTQTLTESGSWAVPVSVTWALFAVTGAGGGGGGSQLVPTGGAAAHAAHAVDPDNAGNGLVTVSFTVGDSSCGHTNLPAAVAQTPRFTG